jgi:hypothetical protein
MKVSETEVRITKDNGGYAGMGLMAVLFFSFSIVMFFKNIRSAGVWEIICLSLVVAISLAATIYNWYWAFSTKVVLVINSEGIYYKKMLFWVIMKSYETLNVTTEDSGYTELIITFKNDKRFKISLSNLDTTVEHIRESITKFSTDYTLVDKGHVNK